MVDWNKEQGDWGRGHVMFVSFFLFPEQVVWCCVERLPYLLT